MIQPGTLRSLEFDRVVSVVKSLAVTPTGASRLAALHPSIDATAITALQRATTEGTRFLADRPGFPLRAPTDLDAILEALAVDGRALEPLRLLALATYLESIEQSRDVVAALGDAFPVLRAVVEALATFASEIADVRRKIDPSGEVVDDASPALASIRERLRKQRTRLRTTLESFLRGRDTAKYLQEQVVTDRNGRYVLVVRAEHRSAVPGIVHGASASGASLFLEPLGTVDINNDIVALEERERDEVRRILLALTDAFRDRPDEVRHSIDVATELDLIQARARFSQLVGGIAPAISDDGTVELRGARHPLLMHAVTQRLDGHDDARTPDPVPVDILLLPPARVLVIAGPNTGGKTVALKTAGLLAVMAQSGLHIPVEPGSRLPVFRSLFADIGDEQSISASLSTFSAHIANVVSMDRNLALPALVLLDEVGAGTDPAEGGALGIAVIDHFRARGAHLVATTHYDSLKSYASATTGVAGAAFGFNPDTFAPTYHIVYGSTGRSLAIEIAARLGMPPSVIATARDHLTEPEKQLAEHLARIDRELSALEEERQTLARERRAVTDAERTLRRREDAVREREEKVRRRIDAKLDGHLRDARREIDAVIDGLKARAAALSEQAAVRLKSGDRLRTAGVSTGDTGTSRAAARTALDRIADRLKGDAAAGPPSSDATASPLQPAGPVDVGCRVMVGALGVEGTVITLHGARAEVDVRGKRLRVSLDDLRAIAGPRSTATVSLNVDLQPREGLLSELNVIGSTADDALTRLEKFLDESISTDLLELRIVHGHGTGTLRRAVAQCLTQHPLVERFEPAPQNQGGSGATIVYLKD
ncbi:MAG: Smr/MutS family protein [Acidobacteria bacterium]|nr:Smr/MutS family protein [Acidobacteriota bacterium]